MTDLLMALLFAVRKIVESGVEGKRRIAKTYREARSLIATIDHDRGSACPRIEACLKHFNSHKNADDAVAAGWMIAAIQERVSERDLYGWRRKSWMRPCTSSSCPNRRRRIELSKRRSLQQA